MRERSEHLRHELSNLAATAAQCGPTPSLVQQINIRQQELEGITRQLLSTEPDSVSAELGRIRRFVSGQLGDIRRLLTADILKAKLELEKHVKEIRMMPQTEGKKGYYVAEGEWNLLGGYDGGAAPGHPHFGLVAGDYNAPNALTLPFRLDLLHRAG